VSFDEFAKALGAGGASLPLVFFVWALYKRWVVLGWMYDLMREDRDHWRDIAQHGSRAAESAVEVAQTAQTKRRASRVLPKDGLP
jgi:cell division inhibitor SulA